MHGSCPPGVYNMKFIIYEDLNQSMKILEVLGNQLNEIREVLEEEMMVGHGRE